MSTRGAKPGAVIGVDFDNTLVSYDQLLCSLAAQRGLIPPGSAWGKRRVRDELRARPGGDEIWQELQAAIYGPCMHGARLLPGVAAFVARCHGEGSQVHIVSHKTRYAAKDPGGCDLRGAALAWMEANRFFAAHGLGLKRDQVHFTATREQKVARIADLGCALFIDDLWETFAEPGFPAGVRRILFDPQGDHQPAEGVETAMDWQEIHELVFTAKH